MPLRHQAFRTAQKLARRAGIDLTRRSFYSPIPPADLPESTWGRRSPLRGIHFDIDEQMRWVHDQVAQHAEEFRPPIQLDGYLFQYANDSFGHGDADVLYGVIRTRRPARIVELGSGNSSVVIRLALQRNAAEGAPCEYQAYDPYPNDLLASGSMAMTIRPVPAERVADEVFTELRAGDILFVDTTHTVRIGGDVVHIILEALPLLAPGVLVHFHDVPMPFEYSPGTVANGNYWAEMYLLQAFLAFNGSFCVRASLRALAADRREEFVRVVPSIADGSAISVWIERTA